MTLESELRDAIAATSVILVFAIVWLDIVIRRVGEELEKPVPTGESAKKRFRAGIASLCLLQCLPTLMVFGAISYLYLPLTVEVVRTSHIALWNFDFLRTAFLVIEAFLLAFSAFAAGLFWRTFSKWKRIR